MRGRALGRAVLLGAALWAASASAGLAQGCRLALALALDVSSSVNPAEYALQAEGLARALEDAEVRDAILAPGGVVAMAVYEWSGRRQQTVVADWRLLTGPAEIDALAALVRGHGRTFNEFPTAIGYALGFGANLLMRAPKCRARTIDISGDGILNDGFGPRQAYAAFEFDGVTVNGLVVGGDKPELIAYYIDQVMRGPDAFVEIADDYADYARAMRRKLLREVGAQLIIGQAE